MDSLRRSLHDSPWQSQPRRRPSRNGWDPAGAISCIAPATQPATAVSRGTCDGPLPSPGRRQGATAQELSARSVSLPCGHTHSTQEAASRQQQRRPHKLHTALSYRGHGSHENPLLFRCLTYPMRSLINTTPITETIILVVFYHSIISELLPTLVTRCSSFQQNSLRRLYNYSCAPLRCAAGHAPLPKYLPSASHGLSVSCWGEATTSKPVRPKETALQKACQLQGMDGRTYQLRFSIREPLRLQQHPAALTQLQQMLAVLQGGPEK